MKNLNLTKVVVSTALLAATFALGCGSSSGSADGGDASGAGGAGGSACPGVTLYGLSAGDSCFDVVSVQAGSNDGCMLGVADTSANGIVGHAALPVNYATATATVEVGTSGSLGAGQVICNMGTLTRANDPALASMTTCTHHQTDTSMITVTGTNEFDVSVTENQSMFASACSGTNKPAGGMCTSTWTWHMKKNAAKTPPNCD